MADEIDKQNQEETSLVRASSDAAQDRESYTRQRAEELHAKVIETQLDLIGALTADKVKLADPKHARLLNEVLSAAATTSLGTKKLAIDAQSNDQQKAMVALMLSMAKAEPSTMSYVNSVINNTPKIDNNTTPVIDVEVKFDPASLIQGNRTITYDEFIIKSTSNL